jgi:hypothetical protein
MVSNRILSCTAGADDPDIFTLARDRGAVSAVRLVSHSNAEADE